MMGCSESRESLHLYLDGELSSANQLAFEAHLVECEECRDHYERARQVVDIVRGSQPLYPAPPELASKVRDIVQGHRLRRGRDKRFRVAAMLGTFAATLLVFVLFPSATSQRFTSFAADTHLRYAHGDLPLSVASEEPSVVSAWLKHQLPFHLSLPDFPTDGSDRKSYSLMGASLVKFEGRELAYLAYTMADHPISLFVSSTDNLLPSGGEQYASGKLLFRFSSERGLKLITWRDRGLSYALVSDVQVSGAQSCVVCHGSTEDRRKFEDLRRLESGKR